MDTIPGTQSQLLLPAPISGSNLSQLQALTHRNPFVEHFNACYERFIHLADCQATYNESQAVPDLEYALKEVIDLEVDCGSIKQAVQAVANEHTSGRVPEDTSKSIFERTEVAKVQYRDMTDLSKYSRNNQFDEFKRTVFGIEHRDEDYPGAESFFRTRNEDDDLEMTYHSKRSLKCPITMMTYENPVRSKVCPHIFSRDAVMEMISRNSGQIKCPVAGCDKRLTASTMIRDRDTERRLREEEEEDMDDQGEELSSDADNEDVLDIL